MYMKSYNLQRTVYNISVMLLAYFKTILRSYSSSEIWIARLVTRLRVVRKRYEFPKNKNINWTRKKALQ